MRILKIKDNNYNTITQTALKILEESGIVIYPTETCYGIGVDATNQKAVDKLLKYKKRPEGKAISIAVSDKKMAEQYVEINETARNLYRNFLPGPLTVVSKSRGKVAKGLEAENQTLGVRMPAYPLILDIIKAFGKPITATSANVAYKKTPYCLEDILNNTTKKQKGLIDLILDAGTLPKNPPSTVVDTTMNEARILREGKIDFMHKIKASKTQTIKKSNSEEDTRKIAENLMQDLAAELDNKCIIFALQGELGVGKTQFAKGVACGLGIEQNILSPTFVLLREYLFKLKTARPKITRRQKPDTRHFYHIDTWRMREGKELLELGFYKMIKAGNVIVIEWLQKVKDILEKVDKRRNVRLVWVEIKYN